MRAEAAEDLDGGHEQAAGEALLHRKAADLTVEGLISAVFVLLPAEQLHQQLAADAEGLVENLVAFVPLLLDLPGHGPAALSGQTGGQHEQGQQNHAAGSKHPVGAVEGHQCDDDGADVADGGGQSLGDHRPDTRDVLGHAGDDLALLGVGKEPVGHGLQVAVHPVFHVAGDALSNVGTEPAFQQTQAAGNHQQHQRQQYQLAEKGKVAGQKALVNDGAGEQGRGHAQSGRHHNDGKRSDQKPEIGLQKGKNSSQHSKGNFGSGGVVQALGQIKRNTIASGHPINSFHLIKVPSLYIRYLTLSRGGDKKEKHPGGVLFDRNIRSRSCRERPRRR